MRSTRRKSLALIMTKEVFMNGRIFFRILSAIMLIAVLAGLGVMVYNTGVTHGLAAGGTLPAPSNQVPSPYYGYGPFWHPWGIGFFPFGILIPLLFFFLIFGLIRSLFFRGWHGPRHYGWSGPRGVPPAFEEWHRRIHEEAPTHGEEEANKPSDQ